MAEPRQQGMQYANSADVLAGVPDKPDAQQINELQELSYEDENCPLIQEAARMLAFRNYKYDIKRRLEELSEKSIDRWVFEKILKKGHILMRQANMMTPDDNLNQSISFYTSMIADPKTSEAGKHKCQERLDKLLGTEARADTGASVQAKAEQAISILQSMTGDIPSHGL